MSVPREGAECLAEIFREILALSDTKQSNDPKSDRVDDAIKLVDAQRPRRLMIGKFHGDVRAQADESCSAPLRKYK